MRSNSPDYYLFNTLIVLWHYITKNLHKRHYSATEYEILVDIKSWFPLGVDCRGSVKKFFVSLFSFMRAVRAFKRDSEIAARIKLNGETKNFLHYACNRRPMETSL